MSGIDYAVLFATLAGICAYGVWRTREKRDLNGYLRGGGKAGWIGIGISVMATQASAITFLSTPGQGYEDGLGFVQNYFGAPLALVLIAAVFLPMYRKLGVYTAYEFLGHRFDGKTRMLGAALFLVQRGLGAGITIYAPAIVFSTVFGWRLDATIIATGLLVVAYTVTGGSDAVNLTQKYQTAVIWIGMIAALATLLVKLPSGVGISDAMALAGGFHKLDGVDFSADIHRRYTLWSGLLGGAFLALSYFGTDQSQVQRYLGGSSLRECRLGLMFNAVLKVPMQVFILLLGALLFVFYQFERPPIFFNESVWGTPAAAAAVGEAEASARRGFEESFGRIEDEKARAVGSWIAARHAGDPAAEASARTAALDADRRAAAVRAKARSALPATRSGATTNDADYVFISFILHHLPRGLIGLLVAAIFAAAMSSKAAELNALGTTTTVDVYRHLVRREAADGHYLAAAKWFTALWGLAAIAFALMAHLAENLIQAVNILGSIFYGVVLGLFLVAFFVRRIGGTAVFWGALAAQALVFILYFSLGISYLWYNVIGCVACLLFSGLLQAFLPPAARAAPAP